MKSKHTTGMDLLVFDFVGLLLGVDDEPGDLAVLQLGHPRHHQQAVRRRQVSEGQVCESSQWSAIVSV